MFYNLVELNFLRLLSMILTAVIHTSPKFYLLEDQQKLTKGYIIQKCENSVLLLYEASSSVFQDILYNLE